MPTYGYRCQSCAAEFELLQRMSDPPQAACPTCGGAGKRLFFPAGIHFKGSGFYKTDSRSPEKTVTAPASSGSNGDGGTAAPPADRPAGDGDKPGSGAPKPPAAAPATSATPAAGGSKPTTPSPKPSSSSSSSTATRD